MQMARGVAQRPISSDRSAENLESLDTGSPFALFWVTKARRKVPTMDHLLHVWASRLPVPLSSDMGPGPDGTCPELLTFLAQTGRSPSSPRGGRHASPGNSDGNPR